ncbi:MAG TPA: M1 family aminopeptidase [Longimicrobiales bacterium]|nr:M1 family aminopeptidase [Longimicrobiales bacterium]
MRRHVVALLTLLAAGCAPAPRTPAPSRPTAAATPPADTERVPPFRAEPLVTWGPEPPGTPHGERPHDYDLQHQVVRFRLDWPRHAVVGSTTLTVAALDRPLGAIALDAEQMTIRGVTMAGGRALRHDYDGHTLTIRPAAALPPGGKLTFTVNYETVRPKQGAYFIDRMHIMWTQGETEATRYWVPTYDYPNDKTTWEMYIRVPKAEKALSNGRLVATRAVGDDVEWHWSQDKPASTYLFMAATGNYAVVDDAWQDVPIHYWTYPDSIAAARRGFGMTPRAVKVFSEKTGVKYPWAKYDQVAAPDYIFGGMENVTATTQLDDGILHPAWAEPQAYSGDLVSHELGHQWYGDLLTTRTWAHIWLNEGFATFMEETFREVDRGKAEGDFDRLEAQEQVVEADRNARRPLVYDRWVTDPFELFFSGHIYPKGATVMQMLRHQLSDSLFWKAMNHYTTKYAYRPVVSDDLQVAFQEATGRDFSRFFKDWVYGAGLPVFQVSYTVAPGSGVTLRAREVQPKDSLTGNFDVDVPVEVLTDAGPARGIVQVRDGQGTATIPATGAPRAIVWNAGGWIFQLADFPRPTSMLAYQLEHGGDVFARVEAARLLGERPDEPASVAAVARAARQDRFWGVRQRAVFALAALHGTPAEPAARAALLEATRDPDARVRQGAAEALAGFPAEDVAARLRELVAADSSLYVRGAAVVSLARVRPAEALPVIQSLLAQPSWTDILRASALGALAYVEPARAWTILAPYLDRRWSREARLAAIATLLATAKGREVEAARLLEPLLADQDLFVRQAAAKGLGELGQRSSLPALERRLREEAESRVLNDVKAAVARIRGQ